MNDSTNAAIRVDFYPGAYGPTIRIILNTRQQLQTFLNTLQSLDANEDVSIALEELPDFALSGIQRFVFQTVLSTQESSKKLTISGGQNPSVTWKQTREDWKLAADQVAVFTSGDSPSHHYLTYEGIDDALVEVAYRE